MKNQFWTLKDFEAMDIGVVDVKQENSWVVLWLTGGMRLKFRTWKTENDVPKKQIVRSESIDSRTTAGASIAA